MKTILLSFLLFHGNIPAQTNNQPSIRNQTSIRSVIAQGGELTMLLHVAEPGAYQLEIYSMDGQIVYQQTLQEQAGEAEQKIAFGARSHGVYMVSLNGAGGQSTRQVIW